MTQLGKYWANVPADFVNRKENGPEMVTNPCVDIAGVASSILATPTIEIP
ncbi:hypothetical protein [Novosphingobium sp. Chol11]|nr:hypothetical protein [Novosphingobium sp. Chol11]